MAVDINDLGTFNSINAVWKAYPEGGHEGDYLTIGSVRYRWNKYLRIWENASTVTPTPARLVTTVGGDLTVNNDTIIGDELKVRGDTYLEGDVTVEGMLDAKAVKQPNRGFFQTEEALEAAYPKPEVGWWATVGDVMPGTVYRCQTEGVWTNTARSGGVDTERVYFEIEDSLTSINTDKALSANQGKQLKMMIDSLKLSGYMFAGIATPSSSITTPSEKVFYVTPSGTYTNFGGSHTVQVGSIGVFAWNGSQYILTSVKTQDVEVFDISAYNNNVKYADLAAALNGGDNIPQSLQKGGISVKFIQSSDNKYVQYRLMNQNWSTVVTDWQGVDDEPTAGSQNLVKSGGVYNEISGVGQNYILRCTYHSDGYVCGNPDWFIGYDYIPVQYGDTIVWNPGSATGAGVLLAYNDVKEVIAYYSANAVERTITLNNTAVAFIRPSFYMSNLSVAKIIRNGIVAWHPLVREQGLSLQAQQMNFALENTAGEKDIQYIIQNGTPGNYNNANCVVVRGRNTIVIPGIPAHKYKITLNKTPQDGYKYYFSWGAYVTDSPASFIASRRRTTGWVETNEFVLESGEYGFAISIGQINEPSDSGTFVPIREADFMAGDILVTDITDSVYGKLQKEIDTKLSSIALYSNFTPVRGKYVTDSNGVKIISNSPQLSYIEIPIEDIWGRICLTGFKYSPYTSADTYTAVLFFDANDNLLSREYYAVDGVLSLSKPDGAATCYIDAPVAHIDELGVFSDYGGETDILEYLGGTIMTRLSETYNLVFSENSLTIKANGFTYYVKGERYDIVGEQDYVVDFARSTTRRYLCLDVQALLNKKKTFSDVLKVLDNTTPPSNYVILLDFYYGFPQDGLFLSEYIRGEQEADTIGAPIFVDYETKGKEYAALFPAAENAVSILFFTDPHISKVGDGFYDSYQAMIKKIQQFYQSLPIDFVLSGGDWLNNSDTQAMACYKLGNITQQLKTRLSPCYQMVGNHDTNYQGDLVLSQKAINTIMFNDFGKSYYRVERHNCALYVFDSGTDGRSVLSNYDKEQLTWFAESLVTEQKENIIIASHIIIEGPQGNSYLSVLANAIEQIAEAYNNRVNVIIDGTTYVFTNAAGNGKIRCYIGGHTHYDYINTDVAIPIFITLNTVASSSLSSEIINPRFDLILVDFAEGKLHSIRVGDGENRTIDLT